MNATLAQLKRCAFWHMRVFARGVRVRVRVLVLARAHLTICAPHLRYGNTPAERRAAFHHIVAGTPSDHFLPLMVVVPYRVIAERATSSDGQLPLSSEPGVVVPVNRIPLDAKVVFLSHTRLQVKKYGARTVAKIYNGSTRL